MNEHELGTPRNVHQREQGSGQAVTADSTARIYRARHSSEQPYFMMVRKTAQDSDLSWEARGVLAYLLSKPDDWSIQVTDLQQGCGRGKVYKILHELMDAGYLSRKHNKVASGEKRWEYFAYETSYMQRPLAGKREVVSRPLPEKPQVQNPHHTYKRESQNTDSSSAIAEDSPQPQKPEPITLKLTEVWKDGTTGEIVKQTALGTVLTPEPDHPPRGALVPGAVITQGKQVLGVVGSDGQVTSPAPAPTPAATFRPGDKVNYPYQTGYLHGETRQAAAIVLKVTAHKAAIILLNLRVTPPQPTLKYVEPSSLTLRQSLSTYESEMERDYARRTAPKAPPVRKHDAVFDALALGSWGLTDVKGKVGKWIGSVTAAVKECTPADRLDTLAADLPQAYLWWKAKDLSAPREAIKICAMLAEWRQVQVKPKVQSETANGWQYVERTAPDGSTQMEWVHA